MEGQKKGELRCTHTHNSPIVVDEEITESVAVAEEEEGVADSVAIREGEGEGGWREGNKKREKKVNYDMSTHTHSSPIVVEGEVAERGTVVAEEEQAVADSAAEDNKQREIKFQLYAHFSLT